MRVGLIGFGYWGQKIFKCLKQHNKISDVVVSSREADNNVIIKDPEIKKVLIATPIDTHFKIVKQCLIAGKDVMCEKDLTPSFQATAHLIDIARREHRQLLVDYIYSFNPSLPEHASNLKKVEVVMTHNGRKNEDIVTILGSHALAVTGRVVDLKHAWVVAVDDYNGVNYPRTSLCIDIDTVDRIPVRIRVSTETLHKERYLLINDTHRYELDYPNGIDIMISKFMEGEENMNLVFDIAKLVQQTRR